MKCPFCDKEMQEDTKRHTCMNDECPEFEETEEELELRFCILKDL
jgi:hypothetical protein